ncbi:MAG: cell division protein FtsZ [Cryomorphaceae bacterium]|nr:cell division protein FtsZ [Cryomorphaceae bacterium]
MTDFNEPNDTLEFDLPKNPPAVIKVIGVGGGGGNAVNHMSTLGIRGVDFFVCNTDNQALVSSPVPNKIQLGRSLTEGLGAGANPEVGRQAAEESAQEIIELLSNNTKMVFITAGMGGGTGTGAAPVIARLAKEAGILTVGILTTPFQFEGSSRLKQAEEGIEQMRKNVDSLIVINNNKLREVYGNLGFKAGFSKADEVVAIAVRGIAEVITHQYNINIDLRDANTVLNNSGTAIMGSARATGENRAKEAIVKALDSPLLNDNHIRGAKNVLLLIVSGQEEITIDEIGEINDHIQQQAGGGANIIMGVGEEEDLGNDVSVTVIATGFSTDKQETVSVHKTRRIVHTLEEDQEVSQKVFEKPLISNEQEEPMPMETPDLFSTSADNDLEEVEKAPENIIEEKEIAFEAPIDNHNNQDEQHEEEELMHFHLDDEDTSVPFTIEEETTVAESDYEQPEDPVLEVNESVDEKDIVSSLSEEEVEKDFNDNNQQDEPVSGGSIQPKLEEEENHIVRHTLDDYMALEASLREAKPEKQEEKKAEEPRVEDKTLAFQVREEAPEQSKSKSDVESSHPSSNPFDQPISRSLHQRNVERKSQLQSFNHRFSNNASQYVDELSSVPAYKRQGLNLPDEKPSRTESIGRLRISDDENGPSLRGNNAFLHDNVD